MTNETTINEANADARLWALRTLDLDQHNEPLDSAAMLRLVTKLDYHIEPPMIDSMLIVANPSGLATRPRVLKQAANLGCHQRCHTALTAFVEQFFDYSCDERRNRWASLVTDCASVPALTMRLKRLEPGLDVERPSPNDNPNHRQLIQTCCAVFLSRQPLAARQRREFCELWRRDVSTWEDVTDEALENHPYFFERVAPWVDDFGDRRWREALEESKLETSRKKWATPIKSNLVGDDDDALSSSWRMITSPVFWRSDRGVVCFVCGLAASIVLIPILFSLIPVPNPEMNPQQINRQIERLKTPPSNEPSPEWVQEYLRQFPTRQKWARDRLRDKANEERTPSSDP